MSTATAARTARREPQLLGQTVVLIGGSAGIGLATARLARAEGADVVLTGRDAQRLQQAASDVDARSTAAFDANDPAALRQFFDDLPGPIDHVLVTAGGPHYTPLLQMTPDQLRLALGDHAVLALEVARNAVGKMRPGGTLLLMGGTGGRRIRRDLGIISAATAVLPAFTANLALELAPVGSTSSPPASSTPPCRRHFSATDWRPGGTSCAATLPIGRVVGPADVAALAVHIMINTALTGATYDIDGGQQFARDRRGCPRKAVRTAREHGMPWFPEFDSAVELARKQTRAAGLADPVAQYVAALQPRGHSCPGSRLARKGDRL